MRQSKADQDRERLIGFPAPTLEEKIAFLSDAHSYNASVITVEARETHMSWVFLAGDRF